MAERRGNSSLALAVSLLATLLAPAFLAPSAQASQGIESFTTTTTSTKAGDHPDLTTSFVLDNSSAESAKNVIVNSPEGIFGNPNAITQCTSADFALSQCSPNSQAGLITVRGGYQGDPNHLFGTAPLYDVVPQGPDETARFAFVVPTLELPISIPVTVRTGSDYGLRFAVTGITQLFPLASAQMTFWGFPADPNHDVQRFGKGTPGNPPGCAGLLDTGCIEGKSSSSLAVHPLTDNPTICNGEPLRVELDVQTYQDPGRLSHAESSYPPVTECDRETFNPVLRATTTTTETDAPSGMDLELSAPQFLGFAASPSEIRSTTVYLPAGLTINPDAADGQSACSDAQANFGSDAAANCPNNAKIGNFEIHTPALAGPLPGSLYFGEPRTGDQYRLFMIADGFGIHAKLVGAVHPDPQTGQLTVVFDDLPQVPFDSFDLHLFASQRGLLATPTSCTLYAIDSVFVPWNGSISPQHSRPILGFDSGPNGRPCPGQKRPFDPRLVAGTSIAAAGAHSSFTLKLDRDDGDQFLGDLNFTMPPGLTGDLRGISYCPEVSIAAAAQKLGRAEQAAPSCPASSQIGTTNVAAGPGTHPFHAYGNIYMAGPLKGAPLSLVAITPALAGPYDYGVVVVRVALQIDKLDAHVIAFSDKVPQIIGGVPIRMRSIQVSIDKPNFMINPTNCAPFSIASQGIGDQGTVADFSSYFNAINCATLGFKPAMAVRQLGRKGTARAVNPALQFDLTTRPGDANVRSLSVTLSSAFEIDQRHLGNICAEKELVATQCAGRQAIGQASTMTPLLDQPLTGPVYAVSGSGGLPRLAFVLNGQVNLLPRADTTTIKGRLQTTVPVIPDAPIGHFRLKVFGGKTGYLINTRSLCKTQPLINIEFTGQNGKVHDQKVKVKTACGGKGKKRPKRHRNARSTR